MKTIYIEPKASKPQANEVLAVKPLNTTKTLRRVEGTRYDLIVSYNTPIAYVVDIENGTFLNETKVILCNEFYSQTTAKHKNLIRDLYASCAIGEFDIGGFYKRSEIDGVDIRGGWNGGTNSNWLHA
jgi:hypothetical protein